MTETVGRFSLFGALACFALAMGGSVTGFKVAEVLFTPAVLLSLVWVGTLLVLHYRPLVIDVHGSAQWASLAEVKAWTKGNEGKNGAQVELGSASEGRRSMPLAWKTDKHVLIVASARSGKGADLIIPNLLAYNGSVFVLDPKGENARATQRHRATLGPVHCLDPWGLTGQPTARFNPLRRLSQPGNEDDIATGAAALAAALVLPDNGNNRYFSDSARQLIEALIAYAVTDENLRPVADLKLVRILLTLHPRPALEAMSRTTTGPDTIRSNAGRMLALGEREFGQILSSAVTETAFLDDPRLQNALSAQDERQIDFAAWRTGTASVFLCLPAPYFKSFNRWLRLVVTSALDEMMRQHRPPPQPVLFILDELATLERLQPVEDAIGLASGYGVQLWPIFQDIGQLKDIYKEKWSSFVGNAGIRLFFGTQDYATAQEVSRLLGNETRQTEMMRGGEVTDLRLDKRELLTPDEIMSMDERDMITFLPQISGTRVRPILTRRVRYFEDPRFNGLWDGPRS